MKSMIVYVHPNPESFNHAVLRAVEEELGKAGITSILRDLYAGGWDPVLKGADFQALAEGKTLPDVRREQEFIEAAELLVFVFPVWWFSMPAVLKGYIDRVFSNGFAFRYTDEGPEGLLTDKKVLIVNTTGGDEKVYMEQGFRDALGKTQDAGVFGFCGMEVLEHKFLYGVPFVSHERRVEMLEEVRQAVRMCLSS